MHTLQHCRNHSSRLPISRNLRNAVWRIHEQQHPDQPLNKPTSQLNNCLYLHALQVHGNTGLNYNSSQNSTHACLMNRRVSRPTFGNRRGRSRRGLPIVNAAGLKGITESYFLFHDNPASYQTILRNIAFFGKVRRCAHSPKLSAGH